MKEKRRQAAALHSAFKVTLTGPPPMFFVSVASKELRLAVSGLESTLASCLTSVDSK
jgi:hypothetical protein